MAKKIIIPGELESVASDHKVADTSQIKDSTKNNKTQTEINTETYTHVENINAALASLSPEQTEALSVAEKANSNEARIGYYTCATGASTAAKAFSATGYKLITGGSMKVLMSNANTADNATLNINSTGAKPLYYAGERASANNTWEAGETVEVYYDGTNFYANNVAGGGGDGVFDVSEKYPTSGVEGGNTYTLQRALTVLNANLPANKKKGGMSIKFVQSSDNNYVQCRYMSSSTAVADFTNVANWQGIDDVPTAGSDNLVKSGGVAEKYNEGFYNSGLLVQKYSGSFDDSGKKRIVTSADSYVVIPVQPSDIYSIVTETTQVSILVCKTYTELSVGETLDLSDISPYNARVDIPANTTREITIPSDGYYLIVVKNVGGTELPSMVLRDNYDISSSCAVNNKRSAKQIASINDRFNGNFETRGGSFIDDGTIRSVNNDHYYFRQITSGSVIRIITSSVACHLCVCKSDNHPRIGETLDLSVTSPFNAIIVVPANSDVTYTMPADAAYLAVVKNIDSTEMCTTVYQDDYLLFESVEGNIEYIQKEIESIEGDIADLNDDIDELNTKTVYADNLGIEEHPNSFDDYGKARNVGGDKHIVFAVSAGDVLKIKPDGNTHLLVCKSYTPPAVGVTLDLSEDSSYDERITVTTETSFVMPSDANYAVIVTNFSGITTFKPLAIWVNNFNIYNSVLENTKDVCKQLGGYTIWKGTQEQYDAITTKDNNTIYFIV